MSVEPTADQAASAATSEAAAGETKPGAQPRLSAPAAEGAEPDAVTVARSRLDELERTANELEDQALAAQGRLATLAKQARARAEEEETTLVAGMVPWARREALAIVEDARRRAAELGSTDVFPLELGDIGNMLVNHFELQERLVRLIAEEVAPDGQGRRPPSPPALAPAPPGPHPELAEDAEDADDAEARRAEVAVASSVGLAPPAPSATDSATPKAGGPSTASRPPRAGGGPNVRSAKRSQVAMTWATFAGTALAVAFVACYAIGTPALLGLGTLCFMAGSLQVFRLLARAGFQPATLVGTLGAGAGVLAAYWKGTAGLSEVIVVVLGATVTWYLARVVEARPMVNVAVTMLGFAWMGVSGSAAGLLLGGHLGRHLLLGAVVPTIAAWVGAWALGDRFGSHLVAPALGSRLTWEGSIIGGVAAVAAGAIIGGRAAPWGGTGHGLELGLLVAVVAPFGQLVHDMVRRDLMPKGSQGAATGGRSLERFSSMALVLPAAYFLVTVLHIL